MNRPKLNIDPLPKEKKKRIPKAINVEEKVELLTKLNDNDAPQCRWSTTQIIKALCENAGVLALAAKALDCDRATLWLRCKANPVIMEIVDDYREAIVDYAESGLRLAVLNREAWAIQFAIRMRGSKRGYSERFEVKHEGSIEVKDLRSELAELITEKGLTLKAQETN